MRSINRYAHKIFVIDEESFEAAVNVCSKNHCYVVSVCINNASYLDQWFTKVVHNLDRYVKDFGANEFIISGDNSYATLEFYNNSCIEIGCSSSLLLKSYKYNDLICDNSIFKRDNLISRLERRYEPYIRRKSNRSQEYVSIDCEQITVQHTGKDWTDSADTTELDAFLNSFRITHNI